MFVTLDRENLAAFWAIAGGLSIPAQGRALIIWAAPSTRGGFVNLRTEITNN